jgi:hypothetical protein
MKLLSFKLPIRAGFFAPDGSPALSLSCAGDTLTARVWTTYSPSPLTLTAPISGKAEAALLLHPWRIELWADGHLYDEEWPAGTFYLDGVPTEELNEKGISAVSDPDAGDDANVPLRAAGWRSDCGISANETAPAVIGTLTSADGSNPAEGWKPSDPGVFAGDCMPYKDVDPDGGERYHVLYLKDRRHHRSKWGRGAHQWAHMSTRDFRNWEFHPLAVSIDDPADGSICTGSWLKTDGGTQYLYYTIRPIDGSPAPLCRSVSEDGFRYRRDADFRITLSERYHGNSARDPKIVKGGDGYHMFVTTSLMRGDLSGRGCLAHLISEDGIRWAETEPIYVSPDGNQPECSDYFMKDGWYYLIFSLGGRGRYLISREPFSGWSEPRDNLIPCENVPKMALWNGRILFTGFLCRNGYAGTLTFTEAEQEADGTLRFFKFRR